MTGPARAASRLLRYFTPGPVGSLGYIPLMPLTSEVIS